jgi:hypothetical protein
MADAQEELREAKHDLAAAVASGDEEAEKSARAKVEELRGSIAAEARERAVAEPPEREGATSRLLDSSRQRRRKSGARKSTRER